MAASVTRSAQLGQTAYGVPDSWATTDHVFGWLATMSTTYDRATTTGL